ncbi:hypothetical protein [Streptomyces sp. CNQ085]|uniref:hypothetical protein n=1 Tax=Streptomyces sp. CNQ085 TaxID=2886944 RepID=UPI001F505342|nr:hypothetical protein [Streptomyces sp. CNQ085]MCI0386601.1 hypothetical protein [Streptomyces sp. CNQ085]
MAPNAKEPSPAPRSWPLVPRRDRRSGAPLTAATGARFVLDAQLLSQLAEGDHRMVALFEIARRESSAPMISAVTIAEVRRTGKAEKRLRWLRSRLTVVPATGRRGRFSRPGAMAALAAAQPARPVAAIQGRRRRPLSAPWRT